jgi:hypothetical protein
MVPEMHASGNAFLFLQEHAPFDAFKKWGGGGGGDFYLTLK